jgi:hypothetical protein
LGSSFYLSPHAPCFSSGWLILLAPKWQTMAILSVSRRAGWILSPVFSYPPLSALQAFISSPALFHEEKKPKVLPLIF